MQVIAIANTKGGCAKTSTVRALGAVLSERLRVLMVDTDPQASLTLSCPIPSTPLTLADVLDRRAQVTDVAQIVAERLYILPAGQQLTATERILQSAPAGNFALSKALSVPNVANAYDVVLIDTPPTLSALMVATLVAAQGVVVPVRPEGHDLRALATFMQLVEEVNELPGVNAKIIGVLPVMYVANVGHHADAIGAMKAAGYNVLPAIGRSVKVSEAAAAQASITDYDPGNPRSDEYRQLAKVITQWLRK